MVLTFGFWKQQSSTSTIFRLLSQGCVTSFSMCVIFAFKVLLLKALISKIDFQSVCLSVGLSVASHVSDTSEAIAIKVDTLTASCTGMHHMLSILTLTFIQDHAALNHENKKYSIISEPIQVMPITFSVKIVRLKTGYII